MNDWHLTSETVQKPWQVHSWMRLLTMGGQKARHWSSLATEGKDNIDMGAQACVAMHQGSAGRKATYILGVFWLVCFWLLTVVLCNVGHVVESKHGFLATAAAQVHVLHVLIIIQKILQLLLSKPQSACASGTEEADKRFVVRLHLDLQMTANQH